MYYIWCDVNTTTAEYVSNLLLNNFYPTVIMSTRITSRTATLIDHIYYYEGKSTNRDNLRRDFDRSPFGLVRFGSEP